MLIKKPEGGLNIWRASTLSNSASVTYIEDNIYAKLKKVSFRVYESGTQYLTLEYNYTNIEDCESLKSKLNKSLITSEHLGENNKILIKLKPNSQRTIQEICKLLADSDNCFQEIKDDFLTDISDYAKPAGHEQITAQNMRTCVIL